MTKEELLIEWEEELAELTTRLDRLDSYDGQEGLESSIAMLTQCINELKATVD